MQFKSIITTLVAFQVSAQAGEHCRPLSNGIVYDCGNNNDAFHIKNVILGGKLVKGEPINIHFIGELNEKVTSGSRTIIKAFYNGREVLDSDKDICELPNSCHSQLRSQWDL
ncbi:hypothetical protein L0F63_006828 [Massospora cicadina]|nr:hypothetical protein L0F63_006828 [Massospora cicadina]